MVSSKFGIVVFSPSFLNKRWPEYELRGLTAKEIHGGKVILPVWHNVDRDQVIAFSPPLADKFAIQSEALTTIQLAVAIIEVIRPDILTRIHRRLSHLRMEGELQEVEVKKVKYGPIRHKELPADLVRRIRLIRAALLPAYPHSMDFWIEGFQRDAHPSREVGVWEHISSVFLEFSAMTPLNHDQATVAFNIILALSNSVPVDGLRETAEALSKDSLEKITQLSEYPIPMYEIRDEASFDDLPGAAEDSGDVDTESFPDDPPDELMRQLLEDGMPPKNSSEKTGRRARSLIGRGSCHQKAARLRPVVSFWWLARLLRRWR